MNELKDLILYENENTRLDFKLTEYTKPKFGALLKDILSMANAETNEIRYIIIGMKPRSNGDRGIIGIQKELTDPATYQQLIHENIEPDLTIEYLPYKINGKLLGYFKIANCNDKPYVMKKDYGDKKNKLNKMDSFIRKGTHQCRLSRADLDEIYKFKLKPGYFNEDILFGFKGTKYATIIELKALRKIELPSAIQKEKIKQTIADIKKQNQKFKELPVDNDLKKLRDALAMTVDAFTGGIPYEKRDIKTLEHNLKNVDKTYQEDDYYYVFEEISHKLNFDILNTGSQYIQDATLQITIPKIEGLLISTQIYPKPRQKSYLNQVVTPSVFNQYPQVEKETDRYLITYDLGDIPHQLNFEAFAEPLRIVIAPDMIGKTIDLFIKIFGRNIEKSIDKTLKIKVK